MYDLIKNVKKIKFGLKILRALLTSTLNHRLIIYFNVDGTKIEKESEVAEAFNNYFVAKITY